MARPTTALLTERTHTIALMLVRGKSRADVLQYGAEIGLTERVTDEYIRRATALIADELEGEREAEIIKSRLRLERLFERAYATRQYRTALAVVKEINALMGLYPPVRAELTTTAEMTVYQRELPPLPPDTLTAILARPMPPGYAYPAAEFDRPYPERENRP